MLQANEIGYYIQKTSALITLIANERLTELGITLSQMRVLRCLWEQNGLTQREIQQALLIKPSSVNGLLAQLLKKKFVKKVNDTVDARSNRIYLTTTGKALEEKCLYVFTELELVVSQDLTAKEKDELICRMEGIFQNFLHLKDTLSLGRSKRNEGEK